MARPLDDTVALVTGSSSGIGAATALRLSAEGAALALVARRGERLDDLVSAIRDQGGNAIALQADVTDQRQAVDAVGRTVAELGRLDTVVNSAGVMLLGPALESSSEEWDRMVALNVAGLLYVTHAALPHLVRAAESPPRRVADLVNISSTAGRVARPGGSVYSLTKFGVGAFSESLRQEVLKRRVRVSVIEPGTVDTELTSHLRPEIREAAARQVASMEPLRPTTSPMPSSTSLPETAGWRSTRSSSAPPNRIGSQVSHPSWRHNRVPART